MRFINENCGFADRCDGIGFDGKDHDDVIQVEGQLHENERVADKLKQDLRQKRSTLLERRSSFAIRSDGVSFIGAVHEFLKEIDWCPQTNHFCAGMRWILTRRHSLLRTPVTRSRYFL